jgi:flagellar biosynthesis/type III secretory pathway protein FliH
MSEPKKYLFDNFIVDNDKVEKPKEVEVEVVEEKEPEPEVFEPEVQEDTVTYTEDEVEEKVKEAEDKGYQKGVVSAQDGIEAVRQNLFTDINNKLEELIKGSSRLQTELEKQYIEMAKLLIKKVIPPLEDEYATKIVADFIKENFDNIKDEAKLSFYIHPDEIEAVQKIIAELAGAADFEGKISLHKDETLERSGCRIEWDNGGIEHSSKELLNKVTNIMDDKQD